MLESVMLVALGFLTATLFSLIAVQLTWRRAVKVTTGKLTNELDLDDLKEKAARNTELETALESAHSDGDALKAEIETVRSQHADAQAETEEHVQNIAALQARINELEASVRNDLDKRNLVETQLRSLGDKATRLLSEMGAVATQITDIEALNGGDATGPAAAIYVPSAATLKPYHDDNMLETTEADDLPDLEKIEALLSSFDETEPESEAAEDANDSTPAVTEGFLADRIRALKAGVGVRT